MKRYQYILGLVLCLFVLVGGCTLAPHYTRPDAPIPNVYPEGDDVAAPKNMQWRYFMVDPGIQRVVGLALEHNRDLRIALLNVEKTRALYRIQTADLLPTIGASGSIDSADMPGSMSATGRGGISRTYTASLGFSAFELDLFGRVRSLSEAALEQYYSVENDAQRARITLVAETAGMYLQYVADKELRDIAATDYKNRQDNFASVQHRHNAGIASLLELNQARTGMEEARTTLNTLETQVGQDENALALLIGTPLPVDLPDVRSLAAIKKFPDVPAGMPSDLLERRPDIMAAEHNIKSMNANIGAARANFFPRISLTGALGTISPEYKDLFSSTAGMWTFVPEATLPIFDTGRNVAILEGANRDKDIAIAMYEKTIQVAFREVADALVQRQHIGEQVDAQGSLLSATKETVMLAETRYSVGVDNQLTLLDAQRSLYAAQQGYINTMLLREINALSLYKAMGGGWQ